jgi:hypothetical protein
MLSQDLALATDFDCLLYHPQSLYRDISASTVQYDTHFDTFFQVQEDLAIL